MSFLGLTGAGLGAALGTGISQGATSLGASASSGGILGLFGIGNKKREKRQLENQIKLNEAAAQTNYKYGQMAAQNAFNRQMYMYERSYNDQSYAAMRKQMEDAGLNVGLMYGDRGASGGGAGSMSGAPKGDTGGAQAGQADSPAAQAAMRNEQLRLGLELRNLAKQGEVMDSERDKNLADAAKQKAEADRTRKLTPYEADQYFYQNQDLFRTSVERSAERWMNKSPDQMSEEDVLNSIGIEKHGRYGTWSVSQMSMKYQERWAQIIDIQKSAEEKDGNAEAAKALAALNTERQKYVYMETMAKVQTAAAAMMQAENSEDANVIKAMEVAVQEAGNEIRKLSMMYEYGLEASPKFWTDVTLKFLNTVGGAVAGASAAGRIGKLAKTIEAAATKK